MSDSSSGRKIYIVVGTSGDYEEKDWWNVAAFTDESMANEFATAAQTENERVYEINKKRLDRSYDSEPYIPAKLMKNKYDGREADGDAMYHVEKLKLVSQ